ncbi:protein CUSTOS isoform X1 [Zalophus californianus]|uniref:Protein CUSTOS n=1 Tax=Zalophus californianus TaxID=9704 RepID=A0A6J2BQA7_ZALCA|nr:protein CUSTOS isoform X1 [Zalophus californianus]
MAVPCGPLSDLESSSSSDAEELARCREAAMPAWGLEQRQGGPEKPRADARNNQRPATQPSLRHKVDEHEQDGNELQTTPEFRAHIAKKLGALLDSSITISEVVKEPAKAEVQKVPAEDDGFRLFFTSVPGGSEKNAAPQPGRKRLPPSSRSQKTECSPFPGVSKVVVRGCPPGLQHFREACISGLCRRVMLGSGGEENMPLAIKPSPRSQARPAQSKNCLPAVTGLCQSKFAFPVCCPPPLPEAPVPLSLNYVFIVPITFLFFRLIYLFWGVCRGKES